MARDDLHDPLGYDPQAADRDAAEPFARPLPWRLIAWGGCGLLAASLAAFAVLTAPDSDGEPRAVASIDVKPPEPPPAPARVAAVVSPETTGSIAAAPAGPASAQDIEAQSGVRVVRTGGGKAPGALIIQVPDAAAKGRLAPAPDARLVEKGRFGPLPRIAADGSRAADVYARPAASPPGLKPGAPRIAILVGGLGLAAGPTQEAIDRLPAAVTLGFAPYGNELERQAGRAREAGHEIVLQAPMEPFDYPQNDPGPHTLRAEAESAQILDDLRWQLSRFSGYVGVASFLGAKFTANKQALSPVLNELSARGLIYIDDGASPQSVAGALAPSFNLPAIQADVSIDLDRRPESVAAALVSLEALARSRGQAVGVASALPGSVAMVARFASALERRGVLLVPLSAIARSAPRLTAERP